MLSLDINTLHRGYRDGTLTPEAVVTEVYRRIAARGDDHVWLHLVPEVDALAAARDLQARVPPRRGPDVLSLYGLPFSVKDNLHVAGMPTTAGCPAFSHIAEQTATAIVRACDGGAILVGKTNMDQFANGLVGVRSPTGFPVNLFNPEYIPGGSSSGAGISVGAGLVSFAFGSDTGGSGRVPGAMCNVVGLKPTPGVISVAGFFYANRSFDVCPVFALTVEDACRVFEAVRGFDPADDYSLVEAAAYDISPRQPEHFLFGVPAAADLTFFGDRVHERQYAQALERLEAMGGRKVEIDFAPFREAGRMLFDSPVLAERLVDLAGFFESRAQDMHHTTYAVTTKALGYSAADAYKAQYQLRRLKRRVDVEMDKCDVLVLPTTGTIYRIAEVEADPITLNANNGYYTYFANPMQLSAVSVPASFRGDGLPFAICFVAGAMEEGLLRGLAGRFHALSGLPAGATGVPVASLYAAV